MIAPYLDSSAIIYLLEGSAAVRAQVVALLAAAQIAPSGRLITSQLARLETRVKPLRVGDAGLLATYDAFFSRARVELREVTAAGLDRATALRAAHGFKTADAIHLATAVEAGADGFVTGDAALARCPGLVVSVLTP